MSNGEFELIRYIEYVKLLLESIATNGSLLEKMSIDFVKTNHGYYFIGLHTCKLQDRNAPQRFSLGNDTTKSSIPSLNMCKVHDENICERLQRTSHRRTNSSKIYQSNSAKTMRPSSRMAKPTSFLLNIETQRTRKQKEIESEVDKLITRSDSSNLKYMSYQKFIKRREDKLPDLPLEREFARQIVLAKNMVKHKHTESLSTLKTMVQTMENMASHVDISGNYVASQAAKMLLGRLTKPALKSEELVIQKSQSKRFSLFVDRIAEEELKNRVDALDIIQNSLKNRKNN